DSAARRCQVHDRRQLRPLEDLSGRLRLRRANEHAGLAVAIDQMGEPGLNAAVKVTDRVPFLLAGRQLWIIVAQWVHLAQRREPFRILEGHSLRALEIHEMSERPLPERNSAIWTSGGYQRQRMGKFGRS